MNATLNTFLAAASLVSLLTTTPATAQFPFAEHRQNDRADSQNQGRPAGNPDPRPNLSQPGQNPQPGYGQPSGGNNPQPGYTTPQPGNNQPGYGNNPQPGYGTNPQPSNNQPGYGNNPQPGYGTNPRAGNNQPGYGTNPGYNNPQPGYGQPQPGYGYGQPGYGYGQPGYGRPRHDDDDRRGYGYNPGHVRPAPGYGYNYGYGPRGYGSNGLFDYDRYQREFQIDRLDAIVGLFPGQVFELRRLDAYYDRQFAYAPRNPDVYQRLQYEKMQAVLAILTPIQRDRLFTHDYYRQYNGWNRGNYGPGFGNYGYVSPNYGGNQW